MANNIKGITIEIGGSTQKLDQALKGVNTTAKSLQNELKAVNVRFAHIKQIYVKVHFFNFPQGKPRIRNN